MRYSAVIFDCDGVLVDSERPMMDLLYEDMLRFGATTSRKEIEGSNLGGALPEIAARLRTLGLNLPDDWIEDFYSRLYAKLAEGTTMIPNVDDVVFALETRAIPIAVGSNGRPEKMDITLGQHPKLRDAFAGHLYSGQTLGATKPAPDLYLHVAAKLGVQPRHCAVIEDSPTGALAARRAGMDCFGYAPEGDGNRLSALSAQLFSDMRELPGLLGL